MKRFMMILLAVFLCFGLAACVSRPGDPTTEATTPTIDLTVPTGDSTVPSIGDPVIDPDDMPEKPTADFTLPPEEHPGDRNDAVDK